jgi:hypothetical protein
MSFNGSGVFSLVAGNPVVTGTTISSAWANNTLSDIANNGLTLCLTKDGQQTPTANIGLGGFRLTSVGAAVARTDAPNAGQVQDSTFQWLGTASGTDTITASTSVPSGMTTYAAGQTFRFASAGANATTTVTLNINGIGAKNVTKAGALPLFPGDIPSGSVAEVTYDGTQFELKNPGAGLALNSIIAASRDSHASLLTAGTTVTFAAGQIVVGTALGGQTVLLTNFSQSVNLSTVGAGGMDVGTAPVSGYVTVYAMYNPSTGAKTAIACNVTTSNGDTYTGANAPSGYTLSLRLAMVPTNGSSQFVAFTLTDRTVVYPDVTVLSTTATAATPTSLSVSSAIPPNVKFCHGSVSFNNSNGGSVAMNMALYPSSSTALVGRKLFQGQITLAGGSADGGPFENLMVTTSQTIYYTAGSSLATPQFVITITGFTF